MELNYKPYLPEKVHPIYIIGAGGIVRDAHMPAYRKAGFEVGGITNIDRGMAEKVAGSFGIPNIYDSVEDMAAAAPGNAVFDLAIMPAQFTKTLEKLPDGASVLIQKPMGDHFQESLDILEVCRRKKLKAAVNTQLRFAPFVLAARDLLNRGLLGQLYDIEIRISIYTPWDYFPNVVNHPRLEIQQHSIHYVDLIRSFLGDPEKVYARTFKHPEKHTSSSRTNIVMDYRNDVRAVINTNHDHNFGMEKQESFIKMEGTRGAVKAKMGLLMNYPEGVPDEFEYCLLEEGKDPTWIKQDLEGSWFPDAFIGTMSSLMRFVEGSTDCLPTGVEDVIKTMAVVESCYQSSDHGGESPNYFF